MQNFFNLSYVSDAGTMKVPEWLYVRDGLRRNLATTLRYSRHNPSAVKSSHFLVRLLQSIAVPQSQLIERYYDNTDAMSMNLSMAMKMTSEIYRGNLFEGIFYGPGTNEIIIAHNESFDPAKATKDWIDLQPVQVLRHPFSDLNLAIPDGGRHSFEEGLAVITVNIPLLAVMYRAFRMQEQLLTGDSESQRSAMQFVRMYVLPNMLLSHLDVAIFNRADNLSKNAPMGDSTFRHSFFLTDYEARADYIQKSLLGKLQRVGKDFTGILRTIPAVTADSMEVVMQVPELAQTRQVAWALFVSRLNMLNFVLRLSQDNPSTMNQSEINKLRRDIIAYRTDRILREALPIEVYNQVDKELEVFMGTR